MFIASSVVKRIFIITFLIALGFIIFHKKQVILLCRQTPNDTLQQCPLTPPNLVGPFTPDLTKETLASVEERLANGLQLGGYHKPTECTARSRVAILVPCRDRDHQVPVLLKNLHPFLMRQQIEYQIFVIYQTHGYWFNRGALFNAGYIEAMKVQKWDCFILHDIDLVPMDDRNLYDCPRLNPRHLAIDLDKFDYHLFSQNYSGGVIAVTQEQYEKSNGHSNTFWGWGGEDNDFFGRLDHAGYYLSRYPHDVARYRSMDHDPSFRDPSWHKHMRTANMETAKLDGVNSIKYHVKEMERKNTFTRIVVELNPAEIGGDAKKVVEANAPDYEENFEWK